MPVLPGPIGVELFTLVDVAVNERAVVGALPRFVSGNDFSVRQSDFDKKSRIFPVFSGDITIVPTGAEQNRYGVFALIQSDIERAFPCAETVIVPSGGKLFISEFFAVEIQFKDAEGGNCYLNISGRCLECPVETDHRAQRFILPLRVAHPAIFIDHIHNLL